MSIVNSKNKDYILVVGDIIFDNYIVGGVRRLSPEAPVPVVNVRQRFTKLGGAANVAMNIASLGSNVTLIGVVGDTGNETRLKRDFLELKYKVDGAGQISFVNIGKGRVTEDTTKTRIIGNNQQIVRIDKDTLCVLAHTDMKPFLDKLPAPKGVVVADYNKGVVGDDTIRILKQQYQDVPIIVDPYKVPSHRYVGSTYLLPNYSEAQYLTDEQDVASQVSKLQTVGANIIITLGEDGVYYGLNTGEEGQDKGFPVDVYDVTGAGDTFVAVFAHYITNGTPPLQAIKYANRGASAVVKKLGVGLVQKSDIAKE